MGCSDTRKLSDSGTEKRLRNGPFAENARWLALARVLHALQRSALDNLPGVACGVLKPSAEQQGVQEQRQDGVLGGPRCRKESRQPTHAAWSSASAACIIHQLHVESPGVFTKCYHIDWGNLLQYKLIHSSHMYVVLKKVPEYRYPLYYRKF
jgi:hypothetical protein